MEYFRYKRTLQWMSVVLDDWRAWGYRSNIKWIVASTNCLNDWQIDYLQCYWGLMRCVISDNFINFVSYIEMQSKIIRLYLFWYFLLNRLFLINWLIDWLIGFIVNFRSISAISVFLRTMWALICQAVPLFLYTLWTKGGRLHLFGNEGNSLIFFWSWMFTC